MRGYGFRVRTSPWTEIAEFYRWIAFEGFVQLAGWFVGYHAAAR